MELINRTILITGGSSGIGLALAKQFINRQCRVIVCSRSKSKLDAAKQALPSLITIQCDINNLDNLNSLVSFLSCNYPQLDTLINNAGVQHPLDFTDDSLPDRDIITEINTNLTAQILITRRLFNLLNSKTNPAILFMGSALGFVPKYSVPVYSASKAGINSFIQSLRAQFKPFGIEVYQIIPEIVETPMTQHRVNEKKMTADQFAIQVIKRLAENKYEIYSGKTGLLNVLNRVMPSLAAKLINKQFSV